MSTYLTIYLFVNLITLQLCINLCLVTLKKEKTKKVKQKRQKIQMLQKKSIYSLELCNFVIMNSNFPLYIDFRLLINCTF